MRIETWIAVVAFVAFGGAASAQLPIVYPAKGQTSDQQAKDTAECQSWAKQTTGIDPVAVAQTPTPPPPAAGGGERARGAARGAAGGAAIGAIAGDAGKGAGAGAVAGTMAGGRQARQKKAAQQQAAEGEKQKQIDTYNRAYAACMEGRGYTVK